MFVIGARTTRHVNQDGVCTEIYFNFFPFHLVNVNNDITGTAEQGEKWKD